MSKEQLKAFLEAVRADTGFQEKLKAATDADTVVEIAKGAGFLFSAEELQKAEEISDEGLEGVVGGVAGCVTSSPYDFDDEDQTKKDAAGAAFEKSGAGIYKDGRFIFP